MTRAHNDRIIEGGQDSGYSIRIGKTLPSNSVNLAYVHTPDITPRDNLIIADMSQRIPENQVTEHYRNEKMFYPDSSFLLRDANGLSYLPSRNLLISDEFSIPSTSQDSPTPLYYQAETLGLFDARGATLSYYESGYTEKPQEEAYDYAGIDKDKSHKLLYLGNKIQVTKLDGTPVNRDQKFKIQLLKQSGAGIPEHAYKVVIFTNFKGNEKETYLIRYNKYNLDGTHLNDCTEILNAQTIFSEVHKSEMDILASSPKVDETWKAELSYKEYAVTETDDHKYQVYAPSQIFIADTKVRKPNQFKYRVRGKLKTKFSSSKNGTVNIGMAYLNDAVFLAQDLSGAIKKIYEHPLKPPYLDFKNPHPPQMSLLKEDPRYWEIDLAMPEEYLNDYDLIVITGYGAYDAARFNDGLRNYLQNGGRIWIDNAGSGNDVLKLENFLLNLGFSTVDTHTGKKSYALKNIVDSYEPASLERMIVDRLYLIDQDDISIGQVNPKIVMGAGEDIDTWTTLLQYASGDPSVIKKTVFDHGTIIVSNCGVMRALYGPEQDNIRLLYNIILSSAEEKWVNTPWIQDYVYHKDNLFKEEYQNGGRDLYIDDRSDTDSRIIVAKKIIEKSVRDALIPYSPSSYYQASGVFTVEVDSDIPLSIANNDFESGYYDEATNTAVTSWTTNQTSAIPGWDVHSLNSTSPVFEHVSNMTKRGLKAVKITAGPEGSQSRWISQKKELTAGSYRINTWLKTENIISTVGARIGVYNSITGLSMKLSDPILGTRDWVKVTIDFSLTETTEVSFAIGFLDGAGKGIIWSDLVELISLGSVYMTPVGNGAQPLYAYTMRPNANAFDLKSEGFLNGDVTIYDPSVSFSYTIKSFVHYWNNERSRYERKYGKEITYRANIKRSDGYVNLGLLTTMVPQIQVEDEGELWADRNKIFYEISIGDTNGVNEESRFVNVSFFNTKTGQYLYESNGESIIGHAEIFNTDTSLLTSIIVQASTSYYTIRATKRRYSIKLSNDNRIYLEYPTTRDDRDSWYLRIHNGAFTKSSLSREEWIEVGGYYQDRPYGTHSYYLPEYDRQLFVPNRGIKKVSKEIAEYLNDTTIKVQNYPLHILKGESYKEEATMMEAVESRYFQARQGNWLKTEIPKVYIGNDPTPQAYGYDIDYKNGIVIFENPVSDKVYVDYSYNNLNVFLRKYQNSRVKEEKITSGGDLKTFVSKNKNWLLYPTPIVKKIPYGSTETIVVPVNTYTIDYENGLIVFKEDISEMILVDYSYCIDRPLKVKDYDIQRGLIYLDSSITFKDEICVDYFYEERFVEYRGYYDEEIKQFMYLDLNPSEGHYCTMPYFVEGSGSQQFHNVPTAQLMNKEIYVYLLPASNSFGETNQFTIRHCFSKQEWQKIRTSTLVAQLLGIIQLRENSKVEDAIVLDTRVRGGGLKKEISRETILNKDSSSLSYFDMGPFDGAAYYSNGVVVIEIPKKVLQSEGGQFTEKEVTDIVRKYAAYGVYCMIEYV